MPLSVGIVGLPNVGKSTLFNALAQGSAAASNFPFCTIEPNIGVVEVPDERLARLREMLEPDSCTPTAIRFIDLAGLVRGASKGEGRGNQFLADVRDADALIHVVRCFDDPGVSHVEERLDPLRDVTVVESELMLADLESVEKSLPVLDRVVRTDPASPRRLELETLRTIQAGLLEADPVHSQGLSPEQAAAVRSYDFLSAKPVIYVANVGEEEAAAAGERAQLLMDKLGSEAVLSISAQIESEIAQLAPEERSEFVRDLGLPSRGIDRLVTSAYALLELVTFYTYANGKLQAWQLRRGTPAPEAAGRIHTDMAEGFIRAEVVSFAELVEVGGGVARLRETGRLRTEGKDYVIEDGDVVHFLFRK